MERNRDLLKRGTVLVDPDDPGEEIRALFYLEHTIEDGRIDKAGNHRAVSRQLQFIEIDSTGTMKHAGYAPYLDYRATTPEEHAAMSAPLESQTWLKADLESAVVGHAIETLVPKHIQEVSSRRKDLVVRTMAAVTTRTTTAKMTMIVYIPESGAFSLAECRPRGQLAAIRGDVWYLSLT